MAWKQDVQPNYDAEAIKYLCLSYVDNVFGASHHVAWAKLSWDGAVGRGTHHTDRDLPDVAVPVYFSWVGDLHDGDGRQDYGHVVVWNPGDGKFYSTRFDGNGHRTFDSIDELVKVLPGRYLGWSEDIDGTRVAHYEEESNATDERIGYTGTAEVIVDYLNVRNDPSIQEPAKAQYMKGNTFNFDSYIDTNGHRWLSYVSYGGERRYVAQGGDDGNYVVIK